METRKNVNRIFIYGLLTVLAILVVTVRMDAPCICKDQQRGVQHPHASAPQGISVGQLSDHLGEDPASYLL